MLPTQTTSLHKKIGEIRREAEERDGKRRAEKSGVAYADLRKAPVSLEALKLIPEEEAKRARVAAIELKAREVALAAYDPQSPLVKKIIQSLAEKQYAAKVFVASLSGLEEAWHFYQFVSAEAGDITGKVEIEKQGLEELLARLKTVSAVEAEFGTLNFQTTATSNLLRTILAGALANRASDIHLESEERSVKIRFRLDGILHDIFEKLPVRNYDALLSRIKLLSGLKINVRGEPQDGRFTIQLAKKEVEVRVSIIPSEFGEAVVMRLLDPDAIGVELENLGLRADDLEIVKREIAKPHGLILNTGPTGSGKTTTLYAFLKKIVSPEVKVITVEDPIEYRISGIEQTQVDPEAKYTFASGLRAIVRQDPDVILVGEIRDKETADITMQASLTGHMVLSTLHTNDAIGAVPRLIDLGVKPETIGPAVSLIIAQRLVRILCPDCRKEVEPSADAQTNIKKFFDALPARADRKPYKKIRMYEAVGCVACNTIGYKGRVGIFEFFSGGPELEETISKDASTVALARLAKKQGMVTMQEDGILKALAGMTTFEEVEKATGPLVWQQV